MPHSNSHIPFHVSISIEQTSMMANVKKKNLGYKPNRLIWKKSKLFFYEAPLLGQSFLRKGSLLSPIIHLFPKCIRWYKGPFIEDSDENKLSVFEEILDQIEGLAKKNSMVSVEFTLPDELLERKEFIECLMARDYHIKRSASYLLNIQDIKKVFQGFDHSLKKQIKKCERLGMVFDEAKELDDLKKYWQLVNHSRKRNGLSSVRFCKIKNIFDELGQNCKFFFAEYNKKAVAGLAIIFYGDYMEEILAGSSDDVYIQKIPANDFLKWEIIKWGSKRNIKTYDMGGIPVPPYNDKEKRLLQFKKKFGGKYFENPVFNKEFRPKIITTLNLIKKIANYVF